MRNWSFGLVAFVLVVVAVTGFAEGQTEAPESNVIGISKIVAHPALDAIEQGIIDQLREQGYEELEFDVQNANGDISTAASIASKFKADRVRLAIGIATPTAQALVNAIEEFPVIYAAVTDPVAAGLVPSYGAGEGNVTGSSDMTPVEAQFDLLASMVDLKAIGHVYTSGETNAVSLAELARQTADEMGIEFVESTVVNSSEVRSATQSIVDRVDAIYVSTDNTVVSALSALTDVANAAGVPVLSADPTSAENTPVFLALGFDYYKFGRATGRLVADVLEGADPAEIPTLFMTDPSDLNLVVNLDVAEQLGITVPDSVVDEAVVVVQDGEVTHR